MLSFAIVTISTGDYRTGDVSPAGTGSAAAGAVGWGESTGDAVTLGCPDPAVTCAARPFSTASAIVRTKTWIERTASSFPGIT